MVRIRLSRTGTLEDLGVGVFIVSLGPSLDGVDGVVHWAVAALLPPGVILLITTPVTVVIATVMVIVAPIIVTSVVVVAIFLVGPRSSPNILLDLLVDLVSICLLFRHHEQVLDRFRPLTEQLSPKGIMIAEAPNKCKDGLIVVDDGDGYPCLREAADVVTQRLIRIVSDFL
jgi:hypothetical protein